ncbi:hypothetical protein CHARACLAT_025691, partial [Characodon lateralis]|nr:hypothetical protein [Characodon lateralis]
CIHARSARTRIRLHLAVVNYGIDLKGECGSVSAVRSLLDGGTRRDAEEKS